MKIRTGFVSNSSSSSFCIAKHFMTEEQIKELDTIFMKIAIVNYDHPEAPVYHNSLEIEEDDQTYMFTDDNYFMGSIGYCHDNIIGDFLERFDLKGKYMWEE
jgi:hypothetical protein